MCLDGRVTDSIRPLPSSGEHVPPIPGPPQPQPVPMPESVSSVSEIPEGELLVAVVE